MADVEEIIERGAFISGQRLQRPQHILGQRHRDSACRGQALIACINMSYSSFQLFVHFELQ
jgi:hypothetical protein